MFKVFLLIGTVENKHTKGINRTLNISKSDFLLEVIALSYSIPDKAPKAGLKIF